MAPVLRIVVEKIGCCEGWIIMRIRPEERRKITRRLRNRLAPAIWSSISKIPIVVVFTVSLWVSQEAFAQVIQNDSKLSISQPVTQTEEAADSFVYQKYTKPNPEPVKGFEQHLAEKMVSMINDINVKSRPGLKKISDANKMDDKEYQLKNAFFTPVNEDSSAAFNSLKTELTKSTTKVFSENLVNNAEFIQAFKKGLNFKFDLKKLFDSTPKAKPKAKSVKYGLVLKEIIPEDNPKNYKAAIGSNESDIKQAGEADVVWTIGPLQEDENKKIFNTTYDVDSTPVELNVNKNQFSLWEKIKQIKPSFNGGVRPTEVKGDSIGLPGFLFTLTQEQGLYQLDMQTSSTFSKQGVTHQFSVPIVGTLSLGRRYNDKMEVISTSANNILINPHAPQLSVHYLEMEKRYLAESSYQAQSYTVGVSASRKDGSAPDKGAKKEKNKDQYQVKFSKEI